MASTHVNGASAISQTAPKKSHQTEKLALELTAPSSELRLVKISETLGGNRAGGAQLRLKSICKKRQSFSQSKGTAERMDWIVPAGKEQKHTAWRVQAS